MSPSGEAARGDGRQAELGRFGLCCWPQFGPSFCGSQSRAGRSHPRRRAATSRCSLRLRWLQPHKWGYMLGQTQPSKRPVGAFIPRGNATENRRSDSSHGSDRATLLRNPSRCYWCRWLWKTSDSRRCRQSSTSPRRCCGSPGRDAQFCEPQ